MIDGRLVSYLNSLEPEESPLCGEIGRKARENFVPVLRRETASLLKTLVAMKAPGRILEVGTAVGYSALLMSEVMPDGATVTTIEKYSKRIPIARENFRRAGMEEKIRLLEGDAAEILPGLSETYDFIFMDAAKAQYIRFLPMVMDLLAVGGVLVSDNVLQGGDIIQSRYAVARRDRTIHSRMREYLYELKHREDLQTAVVPIGDGVAVSVRVR